jgi:hypothetical protein
LRWSRVGAGNPDPGHVIAAMPLASEWNWAHPPTPLRRWAWSGIRARVCTKKEVGIANRAHATSRYSLSKRHYVVGGTS